MVIFDEKDMEWAMNVFNVGKIVYPVPVEDDTNAGMMQLKLNDTKQYWEKFSKCPRHDAWIEIVEYVKNELQNHIGDDSVEAKDTGKENI